MRTHLAIAVPVLLFSAFSFAEERSRGIMFDSGNESIFMLAPDSLPSSYDLVLPGAKPTAGQVLRATDGNGNLEWGTPEGLPNGEVNEVLHGGGGGSPTFSQIVDADIDSAAAIAGSKIQPADGSNNGGAVSTTTQTFAGNKTFSDQIKASGGFDTTGGAGLATSSTAGLYKAGLVPGYTGGAAIPAGYVGETIEATVTVAANFPTSTQYGDAASLALTPGIWLVTAHLESLPNGSSTNMIMCGISTTSGNNSTGLTSGVNQAEGPPPTISYNSTISVSNYVVNISSSTTYYMKVRAGYSSGQPKYYVRFTAVRIA